MFDSSLHPQLILARHGSKPHYLGSAVCITAHLVCVFYRVPKGISSRRAAKANQKGCRLLELVLFLFLLIFFDCGPMAKQGQDAPRDIDTPSSNVSQELHLASEWRHKSGVKRVAKKAAERGKLAPAKRPRIAGQSSPGSGLQNHVALAAASPSHQRQPVNPGEDFVRNLPPEQQEIIRRFVRATTAQPVASRSRNSNEEIRDNAMEGRGADGSNPVLIHSTPPRDDNEDPNDPISSQFTSLDRTHNHFSTVDESQFPALSPSMSSPVRSLNSTAKSDDTEAVFNAALNSQAAWSLVQSQQMRSNRNNDGAASRGSSGHPALEPQLVALTSQVQNLQGIVTNMLPVMQRQAEAVAQVAASAAAPRSAVEEANHKAAVRFEEEMRDRPQPPQVTKRVREANNLNSTDPKPKVTKQCCYKQTKNIF
eukprot:SAG11_NODE_3486_length_2418_cov_3.728762_2_plen_424_part_00